MANTYHKVRVEKDYGYPFGKEISTYYLMYQGVADVWHLFSKHDNDVMEGDIEQIGCYNGEDIDALIDLLSMREDSKYNVEFDEGEALFLRNFSQLKPQNDE